MDLHKNYTDSEKRFRGRKAIGVYVPLGALIDYLDKAPDSWVKELVVRDSENEVSKDYPILLGLGAYATFLGEPYP